MWLIVPSAARATTTSGSRRLAGESGHVERRRDRNEKPAGALDDGQIRVRVRARERRLDRFELDRYALGARRTLGRGWKLESDRAEPLDRSVVPGRARQRERVRGNAALAAGLDRLQDPTRRPASRALRASAHAKVVLPQPVSVPVTKTALKRQSPHEDRPRARP